MGLTKVQEEIVKYFNNNAIVSASAGSGKTHVMIEKIKYLLNEKKIDITRLLMVTYTEAVAKELKTKITKMLIEQICCNTEKEYYVKQLENMPLTSISTIHGMCSNVIREYRTYTDLDSGYSMADDKLSSIYKIEAITNVLEEEKKNATPEYIVLSRFLNDEIKKINDSINKLDVVIDLDKFFRQDALKAYEKKFAKEIKKYIKNEILDKAAVEAKDKIEEYCRYYVGLPEFLDKILEEFCQKLNDILSCEDFDLLTAENFKFEESFGNNGKKDEKEAKAALKAIRDFYDKRVEAVKKCIDFKDLNKSDKKYLEHFLNIVKRAHEEYTKIKRDSNVIDFADLESYCLKLLNIKEIQEQVQNKYDYVFVDEYQDTNVVQEEILKKISRGNNMFMVGDVKQSIYGFRNAEPSIFVNKMNDYDKCEDKGKNFFLNNNFRSRHEILDFVNKIFNPIMTKERADIDYENTAQLEPPIGGDKYDHQDGAYIKIAYFDKKWKPTVGNVNDNEAVNENVEEKEEKVYSVKEAINDLEEKYLPEARYIYHKIKELKEKQIYENGSYRNIRYSDFAILCAKRNAQANNIINYLIEKGIPVDAAPIAAKKTNSVLVKLISLLEIINNPHQDIPLTNIMLSLFGNFTLEDCVEIASQMKEGEHFYDAYLRYNKEDSIKEKCVKLNKLIIRYRLASHSMSVSELLDKVMVETNFSDYVLSLENGTRNLNKIKSFIRNLETQSYNTSIAKFLNVYREYGELLKTDEVIISEEDCVKTTTIHGSKGLEYPIVFLINNEAEFNFDTRAQITYNKEYGYSMDIYNEETDLTEDSRTEEFLKIINKKERVAEQMRLFYVALTRAENQLYITASLDKDDYPSFGSQPPENYKNNTDFINAAIATDPSMVNYLEFDRYFIDEEKIVEDVSESKVPPHDDLVEEYMDVLNFSYPFKEATKESAVHSVTEINKLSKEDPLEDKPKIKQLFEAKSNFTPEKGIAYHKVMELIDFNLNTLEEVKEAVDKMLSDGDITEEEREYIDANKVFECLSSPIMQIAKNSKVYREREFTLLVPAKELTNTYIDDETLLRGTIDLIIISENENILLDYKFSSLSEMNIKKAYTKQLELYAKAIEEGMDIKIDRKVLYNLETNKVIEC